MFSSNSRPKFYDDPTAINLLKAISKSVSIISGHPLCLFLNHGFHQTAQSFVNLCLSYVSENCVDLNSLNLHRQIVICCYLHIVISVAVQ